MESEFSLTITFIDKSQSPGSIPEDVLVRLGNEVAEATIRYFRPDSVKAREQLKENEGKQVALTADERSQALVSAKTAFDRHRSSPYPGDDAQKALTECEIVMLRCLSADYGPTAVKSLHPVVKFIPR